MVFLLELPNELLAKILSFVDNTDLARFGLVNRLANSIANDRFRALCFKSYILRHEQWSWTKSFRIETNWRLLNFQPHDLDVDKGCCMKRLALSDQHLFCSRGKNLVVHQSNPRQKRQPVKLSLHTEDITGIVAHGDSVYTSSVDKSIMKTSLTTRQSTMMLGHKDYVECIALRENVLFSGSADGQLKCWDVRSATCFATLEPLANHPRRRIVTLSANQHGVAIGNTSDAYPLLLYDPRNGEFRPLQGHRTSVYSVQMHQEGFLLTSASYDGTTRVWDLRMADPCVLTLHDPEDIPVYSVQNTYQGRIFTGVARHGIVRFWDERNTKACVKTFYNSIGDTYGSPVYSLALNNTNLYVGLNIYVLSYDFSTSPILPQEHIQTRQASLKADMMSSSWSARMSSCVIVPHDRPHVMSSSSSRPTSLSWRRR